MAPPKKTVCVIGAGESGLAALKECVLQGLEPTCYDLDSDIGEKQRLPHSMLSLHLPYTTNLS